MVFLQKPIGDGFRFSVGSGNLKPDGWNYAPKGFVHFQVKAPTVAVIGQVNSTRVWRFRVDQIDGGTRAVIAGLAQVSIGDSFRSHWWFRVTVRSMDDGKGGFMIQLWRPIGSDKVGGWSFGDFDPTAPASPKLNDAPFYQAQGVLAGGTIQLKM